MENFSQDGITATETNQAYLLADHYRWISLDFVIWVQISLSEQHPKFSYPEICEVLQGKYPKEFIFLGWHPQCLCHATPILMPEEDFEASLAGKKVEAVQITEMPENFNKFLKANYERYMDDKNPPQWIKDNVKIISRIMQNKDD